MNKDGICSCASETQWDFGILLLAHLLSRMKIKKAAVPAFHFFWNFIAEDFLFICHVEHENTIHPHFGVLLTNRNQWGLSRNSGIFITPVDLWRLILCFQLYCEIANYLFSEWPFAHVSLANALQMINLCALRFENAFLAACAWQRKFSSACRLARKH